MAIMTATKNLIPVYEIMVVLLLLCIPAFIGLIGIPGEIDQNLELEDREDWKGE